MKPKERNGYIDFIRFIFALVVTEFHLETGWFPGGRVVVEGFYMISAFLMMKSIARDKHPEDSLGVSTLRFTAHKYRALFLYLLPSAIFGYVVYAIMENRQLLSCLQRLPLLFFEIVPLRTAGFQGIHVVGISWYLSAMFLVLAILYPLCRKFRRGFTLTVCPLLFLFCYGFISETYKSIAVTSGFVENALFSSGIYRALGASAAGILIYEISVELSKKNVTKLGRAAFTVLELAGYAYLFYAMHYHPKSKYDFFLVFLMMFLLTVGICGLSATTYLFRGKWTRPFGTLSTLIVLNHYYWYRYLPNVLGEGYHMTEKVWHYVAAVALSCAVVFVAGWLLELALKKLSGRFFTDARETDTQPIA